MNDYKTKKYRLKTPVTIEKKVVGGYKRIEKGVTGAYKKIENKFIEAFLEEV